MRGAAHDGLAGDGRRTQRQGFQPAHRAGAGGEEAIELHAFFAKLVQLWRQPLVATIGIHELRRQALDRDHDDVFRLAAEGGDMGRRFVAQIGFAGIAQRGALHTQGDQRGVGLCLRNGAVKLVIVQLVAALRGGDGEQAVAGQLGGVAVVVCHLVHIGEEHHRGGDGQRRQRQGQALPGCQGLAVCTLDRRSDRQQQHGGHGTNTGQNLTHRVGFADIADHLGGVNQIIEGDEVETGRKLQPERGLGHRAKQQQRHRRPQPGEAQRAVPALQAPLGWQQRLVQAHGGEQNAGNAEVKPQPFGENLGPERQGKGLHPHGLPGIKGQAQPGQRSNEQDDGGSDEGKARNQGATEALCAFLTC